MNNDFAQKEALLLASLYLLLVLYRIGRFWEQDNKIDKGILAASLAVSVLSFINALRLKNNE